MRAQDFFDLTLQACKNLGPTSGTQIFDWVKRNGELSEAQLTELHGDTPQSELEYTLGWARTHLKKMGYLEQPQRGIWQLTEKAVNSNLHVPEGELPAPSEPREKSAVSNPETPDPSVVHEGLAPLQFGSVTVPVYLDIYDLIGFVKNFSSDENAEVLRVSGLPAPRGVPKELVKRTVFEIISFKWQQLTTAGLMPPSGRKFLDEKLARYEAATSKKPTVNDDDAQIKNLPGRLQGPVRRLLRVCTEAKIGVFIGVVADEGQQGAMNATFSRYIADLPHVLSEAAENKSAACEPCAS